MCVQCTAEASSEKNTVESKPQERLKNIDDSDQCNKLRDVKR